MNSLRLSGLERLADGLARGAALELYLTPKPGLVDLADCGSHPDLSLAVMERSIRIVLGGLSGPIVVNGTTYNGTMPALALSDHDVASVLTYVRASWGNDGDAIDDTEVAAVRATLGP